VVAGRAAAVGVVGVVVGVVGAVGAVVGGLGAVVGVVGAVVGGLGAVVGVVGAVATAAPLVVVGVTAPAATLVAIIAATKAMAVMPKRRIRRRTVGRTTGPRTGLRPPWSLDIVPASLTSNKKAAGHPPLDFTRAPSVVNILYLSRKSINPIRLMPTRTSTSYRRRRAWRERRPTLGLRSSAVQANCS
jgi:hypothetical protein